MKKLPCRFAKYFGTKQALCLRPAGRSVSASETSRTVTQQGRRDSPLAQLLAARSRTDGRDRPFPPPRMPQFPSHHESRPGPGREAEGAGAQAAGRVPTQPNPTDQRNEPNPSKADRPDGRPPNHPNGAVRACRARTPTPRRAEPSRCPCRTDRPTRQPNPIHPAAPRPSSPSFPPS